MFVKSYYQRHKKYLSLYRQKWRKEHLNQVIQSRINRRIKIRRYIAEAKNKPCFDCQGWFEPFQMDFDHRNPAIKYSDISRMAAQDPSLKAIICEISKCDLVCANCHRLRTYKQQISKQVLENYE